MKIGELLARDLSKRIEEIIKVDQLDEQSVHSEISEYIATDRIREEYRKILRAIAEAPNDPHEGMGVWISGFFGSGKSSFAKNLGYILANREVLGTRAAQLMKGQLEDELCADLIDNINARVPTEIVMFDVQTDKSIGGTSGSSISRYMYRALLRTLDYAEDFDIADLEQSLEKDEKLDEFIERFEKRYPGTWRKRRKMAQKMNEASAILHEMDPKTYNSPDSWAVSQGAKRIEVTPGFLVEKTFELAKRRARDEDGNPKALVYIVDEVGAYVARSAERIEDLRSVVEHFGTKSANLQKAGEIVGPTWVIVTSQEKLDEVVAAIDSKRVELAKLQDRFKFRIDLAPADIREVATRRVLAKTDDGRAHLLKLYEKHEGHIGKHLKLESTQRKTQIDDQRFADFYPYPPHLLALSIDIMSGIRLQPGAPRHLGGSNRTIIKQAYEMLVSKRTGLKDADVGRLVTVDLIFELVEETLSSERRKDIDDVNETFGADSWESKVAKAISLVEFIRDLPRTEANLAALLHERVESSSCINEVRAALESLQKAQFVRRAEDGWKLQTASEKHWDNERRGLDVKPRDRTALVREALANLFDDTKLKRYHYKSMKQFTVGLTVADQKVSSGDIPLVVSVAESPDELERLQPEVQALTRQKSHEDEVHWVFGLTPAIDDIVAELVRSRYMVQKYDQVRSQGSITPEQASCLSAEKQEVMRWQNRLRELLGQATDGGTAYFRGVSKDGAGLGKTRGEIFRALFDFAVPDLYPKLEMGVCQLKGKEAEELLKAANLSGLPQVFYDGDSGLGLVMKEGSKLVPNPNAPVAKEILDYLKHQSAIGEKVSGKELERKFTGIGYGWEREVVQLVLAVLLRGGAIEVIHQAKRFRNHQDPLCREPFTKVPAFRASTFAPRESIELKTLTTAAQYLEDMAGDEVDIEEGAIAQAFKKLASAELNTVVPLKATAKAHELPVLDLLREYEMTLRVVLDSASDDCVRMLANEGKTLQQSMGHVREIRVALDDGAIANMRVTRQVLARIWPELSGRETELKPQAKELEELVASAEFYGSLARIDQLTQELDSAYDADYRSQHAKRDEVYETARAAVRERPEWAKVSEDMRGPVLQPLSSRLCESLERERGALVCASCRATLPQMESDVAAVSAVRNGVVERIRQMLEPEVRVERVRVADMVQGTVDTEESVEELIRNLRERLLALIEEGKKVVVE